LRGIILLPIITKLLGAEIYGAWVAAFAIFGLMTGVGSLHLHGSLIRYLPISEDDNQIFSDLLALSTLTGFFLSVIFATVIGPLLFASIEQTSHGITLSAAVSIAIVPYLPIKIVENYPRAQGSVNTYELIQILRLLIEIIVLVVIFSVLGDPVIAFISLSGTTFIFMLILITIFPVQITSPKISNTYKYLIYGLPMLPKQVGSKVVQSIDRYLVVAILSSTMGGVYSAAYIIPVFLQKFTSLLSPTLYPTIVQAWERGETQSIESVYTELFQWYTVLAIPSAVGLSLLAEPLLLILSTEKVASMGWQVVPILSIGFIIYGYADLAVYVLTAVEKTTRIASANIIGAILNIGLNFILIRSIGIIGAAIATVCSLSIIALIILYSVNKTIDLRMSWYIVAKASIASLIMTLILIILPTFRNNVIEIVAYTAIGSTLYFGLLVLLGVVTKEEIDRIGVI
jgi:O-antigen/teichoic acid export membrane protein